MRPVMFMLAALASGPVAAQQPPVASPAGPPAVQNMQAYTFYTTPDTDAAGRLLLRKPALDLGRRAIAPELFPQRLLAEPGRRQENVRVQVSLDAVGQPTACAPDGGEIYVDQRRIDEPVGPAMHDFLCAQALGTFGYHHALGADGQPEAATVTVEGSFGWQNYFRVSPAPPPPAGDVVSVDGWPMRYPPHIPAGARLPLADGSEFLARDGSRPRNAAVGLIMGTDAQGTLTQCEVARPSGIADYDEASCRVLAGSRLPGPIARLPLMLRWEGRRVEAQLPADPQGPNLMALPLVDAARIAGVSLPGSARVGVQLTVSPEGGLVGCTVTRASYVDALDVAACGLFAADTRFTPARGNFGEPVLGILRMVVDWQAATVRRDGY